MSEPSGKRSYVLADFVIFMFYLMAAVSIIGGIAGCLAMAGPGHSGPPIGIGAFVVGLVGAVHFFACAIALGMMRDVANDVKVMRDKTAPDTERGWVSGDFVQQQDNVDESVKQSGGRFGNLVNTEDASAKDEGSGFFKLKEPDKGKQDG